MVPGSGIEFWPRPVLFSFGPNLQQSHNIPSDKVGQLND
jgi:hypothetical protein